MPKPASNEGAAGWLVAAVAALSILIPPSATRAAPEGGPEPALVPGGLMAAIEIQVVGPGRWVSTMGAYPVSAIVESARMQLDSWRVGLRTHPFDGPFFVGAMLGRWEMNASLAVESGGPVREVSLAASSIFVGPEIGWRTAWESGLFLGISAGCGFALDYRSTVTLPTMSGGTDLAGVARSLDRTLGHGVPLVSAIEVGWRF